MLEVCMFCANELEDLLTHIKVDHLITFGVQFLTCISRLGEKNKTALEDFLQTFKEVGTVVSQAKSKENYENVDVFNVTDTVNIELTNDNNENESVPKLSLDGFVFVIDETKKISKEASIENDKSKRAYKEESVKVNLSKNMLIDDTEKHDRSTEFIFVCQFCNKKIRGLPTFLSHIKDKEIHSKDIRTVLTCPYEGCENDSEHGEDDTNRSNFSLHCPIRGCNFKPAWNSYYYNNTTAHLRTPAASWKMLNSIEDHIHAKHSKVNPYICEKCGKGFKSKMSHKYHIGKHLDSIFCESCQHFFPSTDKYANHNSKCGEVRGQLFSCKMCDKQFLSQGTLYNHKKIHSSLKFPCDVCGKKFTQKGNRNTHAEKKHKEKKFVILNV